MIFVGLVAAVVIAATAGVAYGSVPVPPELVWKIGWHRLTGWGDDGSWTRIQDTIVWDVRLPRVLLGGLVGAGLAVVGVAVQALVRNPLADPYLLGISSGASVGAVSAMVLGIGVFGVTGSGLAAFVGALMSFGLVYALSTMGGNGFGPARLVLAGVSVGYALSGITSYLVLRADDQGTTNSVLFWLLGSLAAANWHDLGFPAVVLLFGLLMLIGRGRALNALLLSDETAASLGVAPARVRRELFAITSLVTGVMVALSGGIGFVGLVIPHAVRLMVGSEHRRVLPAAALAGAAFLIAVDLIARFALAPEELPVGIVTAVIGAPAFLILLVRRRLSETGL